MQVVWISLFIGGAEIIVIFLVVLLLFGANSIPQIAKTLGTGLREFRKASDEIKREFENHSKGVTDELKKVSDKLEEETNDNNKSVKKD